MADRVRVAMPERRETVLRTVRSRRRSWCDGPLRVARTVPCPRVADQVGETAARIAQQASRVERAGKLGQTFGTDVPSVTFCSMRTSGAKICGLDFTSARISLAEAHGPGIGT